MKKAFSASWAASKQPRKQRKYRYNASMHTRGKFLRAHLSSELRKKYGMRSLRVKVGDKVKLLRGQFKGKEVKVERISLSKCVLYLEDIGMAKKSGEKTWYPIDPSNVMITMLTDTKSRVNKAKKIATTAVPEAKIEKPVEVAKEADKESVQK